MSTFVKRSVLSLLFSGLVMLIWFSVSPYASVEDIQTLFNEEKKISLAGVEQASGRETVLNEKSLKTKKNSEIHTSNESEDSLETLEEHVNAKDYPTDTVTATGYTAGIESTGKTSEHPEYGITYSGVPVKRDLYSTIAADLDIYPIGTVMFIPDYGYGVVADKGSAITNQKIDLYFDTVDDVYSEWGKKEVEVSIIKKGDGTLSEKTLNRLNENDSMQVFRDQIVNN